MEDEAAQVAHDKAVADAEAHVAAQTKAAAPAAEQAPLDPKKRATHPAVMAIKGHECPVEGCGFIFGDPNAGVEPHPIEPINVKPHNNLSSWSPPPIKIEKAASDTNVCQNAVTPPNDCDECGWKHDSDRPHPVQLL